MRVNARARNRPRGPVLNMARYRIAKKTTGVDIELTDLADKRDALLSALNGCAEGRCSCPSSEYEKVASMTVEDVADQIEIRLEAKPGSELYISEIAYCLAHTIKTTDRGSTRATTSPTEVTRDGIR